MKYASLLLGTAMTNKNNEKIFEILSMYMQKIDRDCISKTIPFIHILREREGEKERADIKNDTSAIWALNYNNCIFI